MRAAIVGEHFFAVKGTGGGTSLCTYYGQIEGDRINGYALCEGNATRTSFTLRTSSGGDREGWRSPGSFEEGSVDPLLRERFPAPRGFPDFGGPPRP